MFLRRVLVQGDSMRPTLQPGDRLVVVRGLRPRPGSLVAVRDPRDGRLLVKRVADVTPDEVTVLGDNPTASTDSRLFGPVRRRDVVGRAVWRYWPPERSGRL